MSDVEVVADVDIMTKVKTKSKPPSMYKVIFHNDDFTPMDFVIKVLMTIFSKDLEEANALMLRIHVKGKGIAGVYSKEIAETMKKETIDAARLNGYPLRVTTEED